MTNEQQEYDRKHQRGLTETDPRRTSHPAPTPQITNTKTSKKQRNQKRTDRRGTWHKTTTPTTTTTKRTAREKKNREKKEERALGKHQHTDPKEAEKRNRKKKEACKADRQPETTRGGAHHIHVDNEGSIKQSTNKKRPPDPQEFKPRLKGNLEATSLQPHTTAAPSIKHQAGTKNESKTVMSKKKE
jgi:hypothetical protein